MSDQLQLPLPSLDERGQLRVKNKNARKNIFEKVPILRPSFYLDGQNCVKYIINVNFQRNKSRNLM